MSTTLHRIHRVRFDLPLAVLFGASAAFAVFAMPDGVFGIFPGVILLPFGQLLIALVAGLLLGGIAFLAMKFAGALPPASIWEPDLDMVEQDVEGTDEPEEAERVRTRRADRHPDAPTREPIRASRDLGQPFMDVGNAPHVAEEAAEEDNLPFVPWYSRDAAPAAEPGAERHAPLAATATDDEDFALDLPEYDEPRAGDPWLVPAEDVETAPPADAPEPEAEAPAAADDELEAPIAAFAPDEEPAPQPVRNGRAGISSLMERLSSGVERRGGQAPAGLSTDRLAEAYGRPRAGAEDLRRALDELNRLAARRG